MQNTECVPNILALQALEEDTMALHGILGDAVMEHGVDTSCCSCNSFIHCDPLA